MRWILENESQNEFPLMLGVYGRKKRARRNDNWIRVLTKIKCGCVVDVTAVGGGGGIRVGKC